MPHLSLQRHRLHYRIDGADAARPFLVFCNSLGTDLTMWDRQVEGLGARFRILRYDRRGHGLSSAPPSPFSIADLAGDVLALMDHLDIARAHVCGLSIGGLVGQWLAIHRPERFDRFVLAATAARIGTPQSWAARIDTVASGGLEPLLAGTAERWFTPAFAAASPAAVEACLAAVAKTSVDAYVGCCAALAEADFRAELGRIQSPVLAISGADDPVCPPSDLIALASGVADGRHVSLPGRHIVNIESADAFTAAMADFLEGGDRV